MKLPGLRQLTPELRSLHLHWSHPDAGGEYVSLCRFQGGLARLAGHAHYELVPGATEGPDTAGREYIPGSRQCPDCPEEPTKTALRNMHPARTLANAAKKAQCKTCNGSGQVPSPFDAPAAARRILAAARDKGWK